MKRYIPIDPPKESRITEPVIAQGALEDILERRWPGAYRAEDIEIRSIIGKDLNGKTLLISRYAGFGDHLWITRIVRKLKELYPEVIIDIAGRDLYLMIWENNPDIRNAYSYPIPAHIFDQADYHLSWESTLQEDRKGINVYDLFASKAGIELDPDEKHPIYHPPRWALKNAKKILQKAGFEASDKIIMIHMGSSTTWKSWPAEYCLKLGLLLRSLGAKIILAGNRNTFPFSDLPPLDGLIQTCYRKHEWKGRIDFCTMEESVALMLNCDLLIGQDSALTHFSAAIGIPNIPIYGPFPAHAYVGSYSNCDPVSPNPGICKRMPCFPHLDNICPYQDEKGYSPCLKSITPEWIARIASRKLDLHSEGVPGMDLKIIDPEKEIANA